MSATRRLNALLVGVALLWVSPAAGRTNPDLARPSLPILADLRVENAASIGRALSSGLYSDTSWYGGTVWAPDSNRWEAIPGGTWTFQSGVGSSLVTAPGGCKPVGYHRRLEGWTGVDQTYTARPFFRRSTLCAISGSWSFWAGLSAAEAAPRCFVGGQGYGNNWNLVLARTFTYPGTGNVTLHFDYRVDAEPNFDYLNVLVDTTGSGAADDLYLVSYTGATAGTATITLARGTTLRSTPGNITIKFNAASDGGYSDEDGGYPSACGHSTIDNVSLTGAIVTPVATFESGADGWAQVEPPCGSGGEWADLRAIAGLPPPLSFCRCAVSDTVMVFADAGGSHDQTCADNVAVSPWIDLTAGGDYGRPGKVIQFDGYFDLALTNYVFVQAEAQWYPYSCSTAYVTTSPFASDGFVRYFGGVPTCTSAGSPVRIDFSAVIPPTAEQVRIAVGVVNYCCQFYNGCAGITNSTPWFDNIRLGVYGTAGTPYISMRTIDTFQDSFAGDGTLNPASPGRIDTNNVKGATTPQPGTALGDTLVVVGDGGNQEVRVVFHVRPGPFTSATALASWAATKWTPEAGLGAGWYSARMDTAEQGGTLSNPRRWMGTLHESDPKFGGGADTDRGGEGDANELSHDIFPDHILTPGGRLDYFVKARYLPPDPRNPGGTRWFIVPDTTGHNFAEMEVLPSSVAADRTWNCVLLVDHHTDRDVEWGRLEEAALGAALGAGSPNAEGTRYDRWDVNASTSGQASLARPLNTHYGASILQLQSYQTVVWHSGSNPSFNLVDEDAYALSSFLVGNSIFGHRFWGTGDGLARSMATENEPTTVAFLNGVLGVRYTCDTIRSAACPAASTLDSTFCLPLANVAGAEFSAAAPGSVRGNGCPALRSYDLLQRDTSTPTTRGQLDYLKNGAATSFAAVTHRYSGALEFRTVLDGFANGALRDQGGNPHLPPSCAGTGAVGDRAALVLGWLQSGLTGPCRDIWGGCGGCSPVGGVPDAGGPSAFRLQRAVPNPTAGVAQIAYTLGARPGLVRLQLFDVSGRLVRTLVDEAQAAGAYRITWDGRDADGRAVSTGMYFYRLAAGGVVRTDRLLVMR